MPSKTSKTKPALLKALIERALGAELSHHLGYAPGIRPLAHERLCRLQKELDFHGLERKDDQAVVRAVKHTSV